MNGTPSVARRCGRALLWTALILAVSAMILALYPKSLPLRAFEPCHLFGEGDRHPARVLLGEPVTVTLSFKGLCWGWQWNDDIVLVVDGSAALDGDARRALRRELQDLVDGLGLHPNQAIRASIVVQEGGSAYRVCPPTKNPQTLGRCIGRVGGAGRIGDLESSNLGAALQEARIILERARGGPEAWQVGAQLVVAVSAPPPSDTCRDAIKESARIREAGVLLITACATRDCGGSCLRSVASSPRYGLDWVGGSELRRLLGRVGRIDRWILLRGIEARLRLSDDVSLLPDRMIPSVHVSDDGRRLRWQTHFVPREGFTSSFVVRPERVGVVELLDGATAAYSDNVGHGGAIELHVPPVTVLQPRRLANATPVASATPSARPSPVARATATPWAGGMPGRGEGLSRAFLSQVPREGVTTTWRLRPLRPGWHDLVGQATTIVEDEFGGRDVRGPSSELRWRPPRVLVVAPREIEVSRAQKRYLPIVSHAQGDGG